jgi:MYXO-CTERM domain-containing protein
VAVANDEGPLRVYANDGAGGLTLGFSSDESPAARDVAWGDWDGDGDPDLAVAVEGAPNLLYENTGGALALWQETEESERSAAVAFADLDGDARMELAAGNLVGDTRVYENPGDGTLALRWSSGTDDVTNGLAIGDFDADGDLDLAEGNAGNNRIWRTADDGGLEEAWVATASDLTTAVDFGDFDGDGDLDLLAANEGADRVYRNDGGDTFAVGWDSGDASSTRSGAFVDYDDDGDDDAVWARRVGSSAVAIARDAFALEVDLPDARWNDVAVGDLDGDGDRDFVLVSDDPERAMAIAWSDARARTERWTQPYPSVRLVSPGGTAAMGGHGDATVRSWPTVPVRYAVRHDGEVAYRVELQRWRPGDRWRTATIGEPVDEGAEGDETLYRVDWDAAADGAWGDGVRLRLVLRFLMPRRIADSLRFADTASTSRAFRVGCLGPCCTRQLELADAGTVCRAEAGPCDVAESCDGSAPTCPADGFVEAGTACGFETGNACDPTDTCDGTQAECPETFAEDGSSCGADACTVATCTSGECVTEGAVDCDDGVVCTADWCDPASGCVHEEIEGCCVTDAECTAGADGVCEAGACVYGGDDDGGCGCRAPGRSPTGASPGGLALALLALVALRRRRA